MRVMWPKRRPSTSAGEEERRWIMEARVGPDMANLCNTRSSMTLRDSTGLKHSEPDLFLLNGPIHFGLSTLLPTTLGF
ncbi:hypothetical protein V6N13_082089 [Hibiscus sabdariffa]